MRRMQRYAGVLVLAVTSMALQAVAAGKENPFAECDRMLNEAQRSSANVPGAGVYLNQARQILNQAKADYAKSLSSSPAQPGATGLADQKVTPISLTMPAGWVVPDAARAEEWSKQMNQMVGKIEAMRNGDRAALSKEVDEMLKRLGGPAAVEDQAATAPKTYTHDEIELPAKTLNMPAGWVVPDAARKQPSASSPVLSNPYATVPKVVDQGDAKTLTPKQLDESNSKPYSAMSDEQLAKNAEALKKSIGELSKLASKNADAFSEGETDARAGKESAWDEVWEAAKAARDILIDPPETIFDKVKIVGDRVISTGLIWTDYYIQNEENKRQEQLREKLAAQIQESTRKQKAVMEEQKKRQEAANSQKQ